MSRLTCESCSKTFTAHRFCNVHACSGSVDNLSNIVAVSHLLSDSNPSVLQNNTSLINSNFLKRSSLDSNIRPQMKIVKMSKMLKEIGDCGLDISTVTSRTRSSSAAETKSLDNDLFPNDKDIKPKPLIIDSEIKPKPLVKINSAPDSPKTQIPEADKPDPIQYPPNNKENTLEEQPIKDEEKGATSFYE